MARLKDDDIDARLKPLEGWTRQGDAIRKQYTFRDFPEAVLFVSALVPGAESADHHPDIEIHYKKVVLTYSTHSEGGITDKDFEGAKLADDIAPQVSHMSEFSGGE
jgi:4a-hydroxytetrahydrobiopterin dehydratase